MNQNDYNSTRPYLATAQGLDWDWKLGGLTSAQAAKLEKIAAYIDAPVAEVGQTFVNASEYCLARVFSELLDRRPDLDASERALLRKIGELADGKFRPVGPPRPPVRELADRSPGRSLFGAFDSLAERGLFDD